MPPRREVVAGRFMNDADLLIRGCTEKNPALKVWRCAIPDKSGDVISVGLPDDKHPDQPSEFIVFEVYLHAWSGGFRLRFNYEDAAAQDYCSSDGPLWHDSLRDIEKYAKKLATY